MSYQVLARKYRPQHFSDVIGQDHVTRTLKNALAQQRIAHGYIFSGHRGIGKTTIARILAMALNCQGPDPSSPATSPQIEPCGVCDSCKEIRAGNAVDVIEIDAATNRGIDEIRELRDAARYRPARDRFKIYILDEAHQITDAAFNALLKTLEEPPSHIVFMMATTQPEDIPQTIRSRCQHYSFHAVKFDDIVAQLKSISAQEGIDAEDEAIAMVAEAGDGSMRDALSIMDQAIASGDFSNSNGRISLTAEQIRGLVGNVSSEILERFMESVSNGSSLEVLTLLDKLMTEGQSPTHFARQFLRYLRNVLVAKIAGGESEVLQISSDERARALRSAALFPEEDLTRYLNIMLRTFDELGYKQEQRFHLELGLLKLVHAQRLIPLEQFLSAQPAPGLPATGRQTPGAATSRQSPAVSPATPRLRDSATPSPLDSDRARKSPSDVPAPGINPFASPRSTELKKPGMSAAHSETGNSRVPHPERREGWDLSGNHSATATALALEVPPAPQLHDSETTRLLDSAAPLRAAILASLTASGHQSLAETLAESHWIVADHELRIQTTLEPAAIGVIITPEIKRQITLALGKLSTGRALKFNIVPGLAAPVAKAEAPILSGTAKS
ncbi:MAG: DNA polymerase III subunit gamma/tau, partial [Acidobacteriaceae bacterium]